MLSRLRRATGAEDGQAIVELALVLPILLIVLFGIFDFGSAVNDWNSATSLANVGARYAAVGSTPGTSADPTCGGRTLVNYLTCEANAVYQLPKTSGNFGLQGPVNVTVCTPTTGATSTAAGSPIEVKVSAPYKFIPVGALLGRAFANANITGTATMRLENAYPTSTWGSPPAC